MSSVLIKVWHMIWGKNILLLRFCVSKAVNPNTRELYYPQTLNTAEKEGTASVFYFLPFIYYDFHSRWFLLPVTFVTSNRLFPILFKNYSSNQKNVNCEKKFTRKHKRHSNSIDTEIFFPRRSFSNNVKPFHSIFIKTFVPFNLFFYIWIAKFHTFI